MDRNDILFAPNGHVSNLSKEDWKLVRMPEFKAWFGDWENDPEHASKVLDENGEPLALWHGSTRCFETFDFSHLGESFNEGEEKKSYTDHKTGEKIPCDHNRCMFFSSSRALAASYILLNNYVEIDKKKGLVEAVACALHPEKDGSYKGFLGPKTREDFIAGMELIAERHKGLAADIVLEAIRCQKDRKIYADILPEQNKALMDLLLEQAKETRSYYREVASIMSRGGLSNQLNNTQKDFLSARSVIDNIDRLRKNDTSVEIRFGKLSEYSFHVEGPSTKYYVTISPAEGSGRLRCAYKNTGGPVVDCYLDEAPMSTIAEITETIERCIKDCVETYNNDLTRGQYGKDASLYRCFLNIRRPLSHDYKNSSFVDVYRGGENPSAEKQFLTGYVAARQVRHAERNGMDGVVYKNIVDPFRADSYGIFSADQVRIAGISHNLTLDYDGMLRAYERAKEEELISKRSELARKGNEDVLKNADKQSKSETKTITKKCM